MIEKSPKTLELEAKVKKAQGLLWDLEEELNDSYAEDTGVRVGDVVDTAKGRFRIISIYFWHDGDERILTGVRVYKHKADGVRETRLYSSYQPIRVVEDQQEQEDATQHKTDRAEIKKIIDRACRPV